MAVITAIQQQKRRKERFNIFVNGEFAFAATAETIFKENLKANSEISQEAISRLVKENEYGLLLDKTLRWLAIRPRSEKELRDYLRKPNPKTREPKSELAVQQVIAKVTSLGYVDDLGFVRWFVESRNRSKPRGQQLLRAELYKKGINRETIDQVLEEISLSSDQENGQTEEDLALRAAEKKLSTYRKLDEREFKQKMAGYLARRGFSWETIRPVVDLLAQKR